jgi:NADPH2:quinone reductase
MQAIHITKFVSSTDELRPQTVAFLPAPGPGEVLVDIACAALNHVDLLYAQGKHQNNVSRIRPPFTLGLEFAGTVLAVGPTPGADFKPGDRVFGAGLGAFASQIVVPTRALHYLPPSTDFRSACGFSATATVAYGSVALRGGVGAGDWVLVHGAAGGIGVYVNRSREIAPSSFIH